ncbi:MAG TPA: hypothetical protein VF184_10415 [Phycisphaeraceae bacterium]
MADPSDLGAVWAAVLRRIARRPALAWLGYLRLERLDAGRAVLRILPGHRELAAFATVDARLDQISQELSAVVGQRVRASIDVSAPAAAQGEGAGASQAGQAGEQAASSQALATHRRRALDLPLVKRALEAFPDAHLMDVREEAQSPADAPQQADSSEAADSIDAPAYDASDALDDDAPQEEDDE